MATISHYQDAYSTQPELLLGEVSDLGDLPPEYTSKVNGEGSAAIDFGKFVIRDTSTTAKRVTHCKLPSATSDELVGVAVADSQAFETSSDDREFDAGDDCRILLRGDCAVTARATVKPGDDVYVIMSGANAGDVTNVDGATAGVAPQVSLTLSGVLDGGQGRIESITLDADLIAANQFDADVYGVAIDSITYDGVSHDTTMQKIVAAILEAGADALENAFIADQEGNARVIHVIGNASNNTGIITNAAVTLGASQAGTVVAQVQAGALPHTLTVDVDGDTITQAWTGDHDDTVQAFADQLRGHTKVASVDVTEVYAGADLVLTLTGANFVADDIDLANGNPTGGVTARTGAINNEVVAGSAAVAATNSLCSQASFLGNGTSGNACKIRVRFP